MWIFYIISLLLLLLPSHAKGEGDHLIFRCLKTENMIFAAYEVKDANLLCRMVDKQDDSFDFHFEMLPIKGDLDWFTCIGSSVFFSPITFLSETPCQTAGLRTIRLQ
jgi:hypothetical protein